MGEDRLLGASWQDQQKTLEALYTAFRDEGEWPTFLYLSSALWGKLGLDPPPNRGSSTGGPHERGPVRLAS